MLKEKKTRLLCEDDVKKAFYKHINDDGSLDNDFSYILTEVKDYRDKIICKTKEAPINVMPESKVSFTVPRVFMFNLKSNVNPSKVQEIQEVLKRQISEGCLVIPDCVEFIGIEDPIVVMP